MYRVATFLVDHFWGEPRDLADSVGVLLLTWNQAFYRYGPPDLKRFEDFLTRNKKALEALRHRDISATDPIDEAQVRRLFESALAALEISEGTKRGRRSPVAVAKALHLLAPRFFPLWDQAIAKAYGCGDSIDAVGKYLKFMHASRDIVMNLREAIDPLLDSKTQLKVVDEYNYSRFTKQWV
jgi:hypothetical protein